MIEISCAWQLSFIAYLMHFGGVCFFGETSENELAEGTMKSTIDIAFGDLIEIHYMNNDELSKCLQ